MTVHEAIRARRSVRRYKSGVTIPREHVDMLLEAAMSAPSACNSRPWTFTAVSEQATREKLSSLTPYARHAASASLVIVVSGLPQAQKGICDGFWPQDCGAAIENILLEALELGYGACWCGLYPAIDRSNAVKEVIGTDGTPLAMITVGVPDESPDARGYFDPGRVKYID